MRTISLGLSLGYKNGKKTSGTVVPVDTLFSSSLWTGNGTAIEINNNIDLTTGFVWIKNRSAVQSGLLFDTIRGPGFQFIPTSTAGSASIADAMLSFDTDGFHLGAQANVNTSANNYVGWSFKKATKFFDVVGYTGTGVNRTVSHSLGVEPGMMIVKRRDSAGSGVLYHRLSGANAGSQYWLINDTALPTVNSVTFVDTPATSTDFTVGTNTTVNASGGTYIAYLFAHDPTGNISCGKYTGNGSATGPVINLGWQPQFLFIVRATGGAGSKAMLDKARGINVGADAILLCESTNGESSSDVVELTATGFRITATTASYNVSGSDYCYMAVRS